ncbi:MAG: tryptophan-rich sensory protein [Bacteroidota bacterium]
MKLRNKISSAPPIRWIVVVLFIATLAMNYLSQGVLFEGKTIGEVSDKYSTLITPAGYAFAIWGLIYLTLGVYVYYQAFGAHRIQHAYNRAAFPLILNLIANSAWLVAFQLEYIALSAVLMLIILVTLIQLVTLWTNDRTVPAWEKRQMRIPFTLYLGWISVATIVNFSLLIKYTGGNALGLSESVWVVIMTSVGAALALLVMFSARSKLYPLVFIWAYVAIAIAQQDNQLIFTTTLGWAIVLFISDMIYFFRQKKTINNEQSAGKELFTS